MHNPIAGARAFYRRHEKLALVSLGALVSGASVLAGVALSTAPPQLTPEQLEAAVVKTLETKPLPSPAAKAWQAVRPSLVRVRAIGDGLEHDEYAQRAVGSGVVIREKGIILTSLHVVSGASRVQVDFADGSRSEARVLSEQPDQDLAVLQAAVPPDDLRPATLGSSASLREGEAVTAVGFPFGIGPSVTAGVVSGLGREFKRMRELIQFDAAANPGSSGGPLLNASGEVVGIVTAIASPTESGAFAGIAFAVPIQSAARAAGLPPF